MGDWGWRIPFVIGSLFTVYAIIMRRTMTETEQFVQAKEAGGQPGGSLSLLLRGYWKQCLLTVAFVAGSTFTYYVFVLQYSTFAHIVTGIELSAAQLLTALVIIVFAALQPVYGWLSDRIGRKKVLLFSVIGTLVTMWPALLLVTDNAAVVIGLQLLVVVPAAAAASVANATLAELFPTQVRALGVAFPYAISVALFGGTAPFVMTYLAGNGHVSLLALYGTALLALTTVAILAHARTVPTATDLRRSTSLRPITRPVQHRPRPERASHDPAMIQVARCTAARRGCVWTCGPTCPTATGASIDFMRRLAERSQNPAFFLKSSSSTR